MFVDPAAGDLAVLTGGSWESTLPLSSLQTDDLSDVARSTAATLAATQFYADCGEAKLARAVALVAHNFSAAAKVRIRGSAYPDFGEVAPVSTPVINGSSWTDIATPVIAAVEGPDGLTSGYSINDNNAASEEGRQIALLSGGDGTKPVGVWVKKGTATVSVVRVYDNTAAAERMRATITWSGTDPGTPAMATGTYVSKRQGANGWWWLRFTTAAVTAANANILILYGASLTVADTGTTLYAYPAYGPRNLVLSSNISGASWTDTGTPVVVAVRGPDRGAATGYSVTDDDGAAVEIRSSVVIFSSSTAKAVAIWIKKGTATASLFRLRDTTAGVDKLYATITWSGSDPGTPAMTGGTYLYKEEGPEGWWKLWFLADSVTPTNGHSFYVYGAVDSAVVNGSTLWAYPWVEDGITGYVDAYDSGWVDAYPQAFPGGRNLLASYQDLTGWDTSGTPVITPGIQDPFGGLAAFRVADDSGAADEYITKTIPGFTSSGTKSVSIYCKKDTLTAFDLALYALSAAAYRHLVRVTFSAAGVPTLSTLSGSGTLFAVEDVGNGWYRLSFSAAGVLIGDTHVFVIYPTDLTPATTGGVLLFQPWAEDAATISTPTLEPGEPGYHGLVTQDQLDDGYPFHFTHVLTENVGAQHWLIEIDDTANADGYVEIGRLMLGFGYQPTVNFNAGATIPVGTTATRSRTDGGSVFHKNGITWREFVGVIEELTDDEAMVRGFWMARSLSTHGQFYFIYAADDSVHMHRRAFPATFGELSPLVTAIVARMGQPFKIVEVV